MNLPVSVNDANVEIEADCVLEGGETMECFNLSKITIQRSLGTVNASFKDYEVMEKAKDFVQKQLNEPPVVVLGNSWVFGI